MEPQIFWTPTLCWRCRIERREIVQCIYAYRIARRVTRKCYRVLKAEDKVTQGVPLTIRKERSKYQLDFWGRRLFKRIIRNSRFYRSSYLKFHQKVKQNQSITLNLHDRHFVVKNVKLEPTQDNLRLHRFVRKRLLKSI